MLTITKFFAFFHKRGMVTSKFELCMYYKCLQHTVRCSFLKRYMSCKEWAVENASSDRQRMI